MTTDAEELEKYRQLKLKLRENSRREQAKRQEYFRQMKACLQNYLEGSPVVMSESLKRYLSKK
jgi:hypothetical protein